MSDDKDSSKNRRTACCMLSVWLGGKCPMSHRPAILLGRTRPLGEARRWKGPIWAAAAVLTVLGTGMGAGPVLADPQPAPASWPSEVNATYRIRFGGMDIGRFHFTSRVDAASYALSGYAKIRAPLGAFEWKGTTNSAGSAVGGGPRPAAYTFNFNSSAIIGRDKAGQVKLGFKDGAVSSVSVAPLKPPPPDLVPLKDEHKRNVLDPLSAVMALSLSGAQKPCDRKLSVFDGKQRFDLAFSFRRQQRISESRPSGQPGVGFVCRVRYMPIAGYRKNDDTKSYVDNANIEITLRPVPSANLMVPYQVVIPTAAGVATLVAERVDITTKSRGLIALMH